MTNLRRSIDCYRFSFQLLGFDCILRSENLVAVVDIEQRLCLNEIRKRTSRLPTR
jgi:hypothetical protein